MRHLLKFSLLGLACCAARPALAQERQEGQGGPQIRVVPVENVKIDYAQVLRVQPVYQTLRATRTEERCDPEPPPPPSRPARDAADEGVFSRMLDSVKEAFGRGEQAPPPQPAPPPRRENCRLVQVDREFQRPIAYDVDYVYKGTKYRSRLAEDPGNRLRIRVSVTPYVPEAQARNP
ncbi:MAG TPA: hypothetical protein VFF91_03245 [Pseudoxanthomonas sp.]|nr:hypothetical protein [Pseudoxanthomonas sp.]